MGEKRKRSKLKQMKGLALNAQDIPSYQKGPTNDVLTIIILSHCFQ